MKILLLTDGVFPFVVGGMQKHSHYLAKFLALRGHYVTLAHCVPDGYLTPPLHEVRQSLGLDSSHHFNSVCLRFPKGGWLPGHYINESYLFSRSMYTQLKQELPKFDFIYAKGFAAWHFLHRKSKGEKFPPIGIKFHGYEMFQQAADFKSRLQHWMLRGPTRWNNLNADYVFSYGGKITSLIESIGVNSEQIIEIPTGIESSWIAKAITPLSKPIQFLFIGRNERRKGIAELNEALSQLIGKLEFQFQFIGPVPHSARIKSDQITYHGQLTARDEIQQVMDKCQVLVTPSHSEGMPNVIMEGMARGLAVIATDVGAVPLQVSGENGWLIAPGNAQELKTALMSAIELDGAGLNQKRNHSLQRVKEMTWEKIILRTEEEILKHIR